MKGLRGLALGGLLVLSTAAAAGGVPVTLLDGKPSTFADQIKGGHWTVVMMWTTYCNFCRKQYPLVSAFHDAHKGKDAEVLGVSLDGPAALDAVREYVAQAPFSFPTVVGDPDVMARMFETATEESFTGTPTYMVFNPARQLVAIKSGLISAETLDSYLDKKAP